MESAKAVAVYVKDWLLANWMPFGVGLIVGWVL